MGLFGTSKKKKEPAKPAPGPSSNPPPSNTGSGILRKPEGRSGDADRDALFGRSTSSKAATAAKTPASQQHVRFGEVRRVHLWTASMLLAQTSLVLFANSSTRSDFQAPS